MGQKIHPVGLRVGVIRGFDSHWYYGKKGYAAALLQDHRIRRYIKNRTGLGNVSRIEIERAPTELRSTSSPPVRVPSLAAAERESTS